jgi:hypothetical protein
MRSRAAAVARPRPRARLVAPLLRLGLGAALLCGVAVLPAVPVLAVEMKTVNTMDDVEDMWDDFGKEVMKDAAIDMCARRVARPSVGVVRALLFFLLRDGDSPSRYSPQVRRPDRREAA